MTVDTERCIRMFMNKHTGAAWSPHTTGDCRHSIARTVPQVSSCSEHCYTIMFSIHRFEHQVYLILLQNSAFSVAEGTQVDTENVYSNQQGMISVADGMSNPKP